MDRIQQLTSFLEQSPDDAFLLHALALEHVKIEDDTAAKSYFERNLVTHKNYVATYYHLGKLLERNGDTEKALEIYETGMSIAKEARDNHTYNELQAAFEDLAY